MVFGLSEIIDCPGRSLPFTTSVDLRDLRYGDCYPVTEPVQAEGLVRNTAGVLVLTGSLHTTIHGVCDRCAADFSSEIRLPIRAVLANEPEGEALSDDWVFPLEEGGADLEDIVRTAFVLNLDSKLLCRPDCKGICCRCGKNLNSGPCNCQKEPDPRWAALQQLIDV